MAPKTATGGVYAWLGLKTAVSYVDEGHKGRSAVLGRLVRQGLIAVLPHMKEKRKAAVGMRCWCTRIVAS